MKKNRKLVLIQAVFACLIVLLAGRLVYADPLQEEFDKLCIYTQDAESLSLEKLQELVVECDQFQKTLEESNHPKKKLLLFRIKKCRNFFAYVIELKQTEKSGSSQ